MFWFFWKIPHEKSAHVIKFICDDISNCQSQKNGNIDGKSAKFNLQEKLLQILRNKHLRYFKNKISVNESSQKLRYWMTFVMTRTCETYATCSKRQTALSSLHNAGLSAARGCQLEIRNCAARLPVYWARHFREIAFPVLPRLTRARGGNSEAGRPYRKRTNTSRETERWEKPLRWKRESDRKKTKMEAAAMNSTMNKKTAVNSVFSIF